MRSALFVALFALLPVVAPAELNPGPALPVVDLRVGLARSVLLDPSLSKGAGQAGYLELAHGGVMGALLPMPDRRGGDASHGAAPEYLALRAALKSSQRFAMGDCHPAAGRIAVWFELEAPDELAREPTSVGLWVERGIRVFAIASERDNALTTVATSLAPGPIVGLTDVGREIVARIHASGAMVDVSGASDLAIEEVTAMAKQSGVPVIATHSNARALADQPRNLSDATLRQIASTGGVIGLTASRGSLARGRSATVRDLVRQVLHAVRVVGPEHVALGIGFEAGLTSVQDFGSARDFPRLAAALAAAGLDMPTLRRIFFENATRVLCTNTGSSHTRTTTP